MVQNDLASGPLERATARLLQHKVLLPRGHDADPAHLSCWDGGIRAPFPDRAGLVGCPGPWWPGVGQGRLPPSIRGPAPIPAVLPCWPGQATRPPMVADN